MKNSLSRGATLPPYRWDPGYEVHEVPFSEWERAKTEEAWAATAPADLEARTEHVQQARTLHP